MLNSKTREEITEIFLLRAAPGDRPGLRQILDKLSMEELRTAHAAAQAQAAARAVEEAAQAKLAEIQVEAEANQIWFEEERRLAREPQRLVEEKAQLAQDRKTFTQAARSLRIGETEANFNVTRSILGPNFSVYQIQQMLVANGAILSPPTQEELNEWTRQDIEAHNQYLLNADLPTLRKLAREAGARGTPAPPMDETQRVRAAETTAATTYPALPDEYRDGDGPEQVLNAEFIRACSAVTLKRLIQRYGSAQIDQVLRGETRTGEVWKY